MTRRRKTKGGFKRTFIEHCRNHRVAVEVVTHLAVGCADFGRTFNTFAVLWTQMLEEIRDAEDRDHAEAAIKVFADA